MCAQADDLMRTAMRTAKELGNAGQDRTIPASVASALSREIKEFVEEEAPLMVLMSSPGIKKVSDFRNQKISLLPERR